MDAELLNGRSWVLLRDRGRSGLARQDRDIWLEAGLKRDVSSRFDEVGGVLRLAGDESIRFAVKIVGHARFFP